MEDVVDKSKSTAGDRTSRFSRRDFVKAGSAGVVAASMAAPVDVLAAEASATQWYKDADVVVVGGGAAGSVAAIAAAVDGARVLLVEKAPVFGGTSAKSGGGIWIGNNFLIKSRGVVDEKIDFLKYCASYSYPGVFDPNSETLGLSPDVFALLEAFYDKGSEMLDFLRDRNFLKLGGFGSDAFDIPDYGVLDGYNRTPHGRLLGPRRPDGTPGFGAELMRQLKDALDKLGVPVLTGHAASRLLQNQSGDVIGLEVVSDGKTLPIRARKGVIFGSGGFTYNRELVNRFHVGPIFGGCGVPTNTGDFVTIASSVGAQFGNMASAWRAQIVLEEALQYVSVPNDVWIPAGDSMVLVNRYGRRVVNEKRNYHDRTRSHYIYDANRSEFPNQLMFMIYDQRTAEVFAGVHPLPSVPDRSLAVIKGADWEELSKNIATRLDELSASTGNIRLDKGFAGSLQKTISRFNGFAATGIDEDFQRGQFQYDVETFPIYTPPSDKTRWGNVRGKNVTMFPFQEKGPYYCIILAPGTLDTNGGPVINTNAQVISAVSKPIKGLYGAGNCIANPAHDAYWGGGATLGTGMTFGYIAGRHAAAATSS